MTSGPGRMIVPKKFLLRDGPLLAIFYKDPGGVVMASAKHRPYPFL